MSAKRKLSTLADRQKWSCVVSSFVVFSRKQSYSEIKYSKRTESSISDYFAAKIQNCSRRLLLLAAIQKMRDSL